MTVSLHGVVYWIDVQQSRLIWRVASAAMTERVLKGLRLRIVEDQ